MQSSDIQASTLSFHQAAREFCEIGKISGTLSESQIGRCKDLTEQMATLAEENDGYYTYSSKIYPDGFVETVDRLKSRNLALATHLTSNQYGQSFEMLVNIISSQVPASSVPSSSSSSSRGSTHLQPIQLKPGDPLERQIGVRFVNAIDRGVNSPQDLETLRGVYEEYNDIVALTLSQLDSIIASVKGMLRLSPNAALSSMIGGIEDTIGKLRGEADAASTMKSIAEQEAADLRHTLDQAGVSREELLTQLRTLTDTIHEQAQKISAQELTIVTQQSQFAEFERQASVNIKQLNALCASLESDHNSLVAQLHNLEQTLKARDEDYEALSAAFDAQDKAITERDEQLLTMTEFAKKSDEQFTRTLALMQKHSEENLAAIARMKQDDELPMVLDPIELVDTSEFDRILEESRAILREINSDLEAAAKEPAVDLGQRSQIKEEVSQLAAELAQTKAEAYQLAAELSCEKSYTMALKEHHVRQLKTTLDRHEKAVHELQREYQSLSDYKERKLQEQAVTIDRQAQEIEQLRAQLAAMSAAKLEKLKAKNVAVMLRGGERHAISSPASSSSSSPVTPKPRSVPAPAPVTLGSPTSTPNGGRRSIRGTGSPSVKVRS
jgi:chromosome segregation ATPase